MLFAVFIAIMHDAYRITSIGLGDRTLINDEDNEVNEKQKKSYKEIGWDFLKWFFEWLPENT